MKLYKQLGDEIRRRFEKSIKETSGKGWLIELDLDQETQIDHVITMEDITYGERVRRYAIDGTTDGKNWFKIVEAISIGHKRIDKFDPVHVTKIRFRSLEQAAEPIIRKLAVYFVNDPKDYNRFNSTKDDYGRDYSTGVSKEYLDSKIIGNIEEFQLDGQKQRFKMDLSSHIDRPGLYELFVSNDEDKNSNKPSNVSLFLQGVETPGFSKVDRVFSRIELNITAHPTMKENTIMVAFDLADNISTEKVYLRKVIYN